MIGHNDQTIPDSHCLVDPMDHQLDSIHQIQNFRVTHHYRMACIDRVRHRVEPVGDVETDNCEA